MALKDLVAQKSAFAEEAIENIVKEYIRYDPNEREIAFTPEFAALSNRSKILVYLVAIQGWSFVVDEPVVVETKPADLGDRLGIPGGTLRPILSNLKALHLVTSKGDGYSVRPSSFSAIQRELGAQVGAPLTSTRRRKVTKRSKPSISPEGVNDEGTTEGEAERDGVASTKEKRRKSTGSGDLKGTFNGWVAEGFFDKPKTLAEVKARFHQEAVIIPRTSIPKYLLAGVRDKFLSRKKLDINGKKLWVYVTREKN